METFIAEFAKQYKLMIDASPGKHGFSSDSDKFQQAVDQFRDAIPKRSYSNMSPIFRTTCRSLGIKHGYKAIEQFIANNK